MAPDLRFCTKPARSWTPGDRGPSLLPGNLGQMEMVIIYFRQKKMRNDDGKGRKGEGKRKKTGNREKANGKKKRLTEKRKDEG